MSAGHLLKRLGACWEAIHWADDRSAMSDAVLWLECDNPYWLAWLADRSRVYGPRILIDALAPIWRARKEAIHAAYDAQAAALDANEPWDADRAELLDRAYIEACTQADQHAASMIRHTIAMPTREQLIAAAEYWARYDDSIPY